MLNPKQHAEEISRISKHLNPFRNVICTTKGSECKTKNELKRKKLVSTCSCRQNFAPHPPFLISALHTLHFSSFSITSHLVSISQGPLSALPAYYVSSMRAGRKPEETLHPEDAWRPGEARHFVLMSFHTTPQKVCVLWRNYVPFSELHPFNFLSCSVDSFLNLPYAVFVSYLTKPCFFICTSILFTPSNWV